MNKTESSNLPLLALSALAIICGLGLLLFELITGTFYQALPSFALWGMYLVLLLMSVWGLKTWLELQSGTFSTFSRWGARLFGLGDYRKPQAHNLFRLPAEGQVYVVMLTIMLLGALFGKTNTLMLIFALMAGPFIVNGGITFGMTRRLEIKRSLPGRVMRGEPTSVDITIFNRKRFVSSCLVAVEDRIVGPREMLNGKLMFALVPARNSRTGRYQIRFMQRGRYRLGPTRITSRFPLGIVERGRQTELYDEVLVYPRIGFIAQWWLRRLTDGQEASRTAQGQTGAHHDEFHRIREYRAGDELRSIHWKTSARRNELMVKEYRQNRDRRMLLILDLWQPDTPKDGTPQTATPQERVELAVSLAATMAWGYIQECGTRQLDYVCFGKERQRWLGSQREEVPETLLDQFAVAEAGREFTLNELEEEVLQRQSASTRTVLITTRRQKDFVAALSKASPDAARTWQGLNIIEADPTLTAEFFQPNPIEGT
ncbi:MAG: hypothetical protein CMJ47_08475 [Planctomyces sp.]|nr:hypothetical protein [Planctomyces sp.]